MRILRSLFRIEPAVKGFICGCGHSGTTLAASILAAHPEVHIPLDETEIFRQPPDEARRLYRKLLRAAARAGKRVLIEKTPRHIHHLELIRTTVPGARFVVPVRDGRDVAASIGRRLGDPRPGVQRWIAENRIVLAERGKPDVFIYRYEDLIEDPPGTVRKICSFLDLSFRPDLLEYYRTPRLWLGQQSIRKGAARGEKEHRALRNWQVNQPIFDGRGRGRETLSAEDTIRLTEGDGRPLMQAFGYL